MGVVKYADNVTTELAANIGLGDTTIQVTDASEFPDITGDSNLDYTYVTFISGTDIEVVKVTDVNTLANPDELTVVRSSSPATFSTGDLVELRLNTQMLDDALLDATDALTGATIKTRYEAEADTNEFTDAEKVTLGNITAVGAVDLDAIETNSNASKVKTDWITVTGAVNLDTVGANVATNNAKLTCDTTNVDAAGAAMNSENLSGIVTPATALTNIGGIGAATTDTLTNKTIDADGTGNVVTNIGASEIKSDLITGQGVATAAVADYVLISDDNDSSNLKKATIQSIADLSSSTWVPIDSVDASTSATITLTGISDTYAYYAIGISDFTSDANGHLYLQLGDSGTIYTANYSYHTTAVNSTSSGYFAVVSTGTSNIIIGHDISVLASSGEGVTGLLYFNSTSTGTNYPLIFGNTVGRANAGGTVGCNIFARRDASMSTTRVLLKFSGGNIVTGTATLWGIKHA